MNGIRVVGALVIFILFWGRPVSAEETWLLTDEIQLESRPHVPPHVKETLNEMIESAKIAAHETDFKKEADILRRLLEYADDWYDDDCYMMRIQRAYLVSIEQICSLDPQSRERVYEARLLAAQARRYVDAWKSEISLPLSEKAVAIFAEELGKSDLMTLDARADLARAQSQLGNTKAALSNLKYLIQEMSRRYGPESTSSLYIALSYVYEQLGDHERRQKCLKNASKIAAATQGEKSFIYASVQYNLAKATRAVGKVAESITIAKDAEECFQSLGPRHRAHRVFCHHTIAIGLFELGKFDKGTDAFRKAIELMAKLDRKTRTRVLESVENFALEYRGSLERSGRINEIEKELAELRSSVKVSPFNIELEIPEENPFAENTD